ncbi:MAG: polysaccharide deacetylase family protein [Candidatus Ozemobacteraceae bacterium]
MKILHLVSHSIMRGKKEVTGADVYVLTISEAQTRAGHEVYIAGDHQAGPTRARFVRIGLGQRRPHQRVANVLAVRRLLHRCGIELVHAHSRAASWVARQAIRGTDLPMISTIHGRQKLHFSTRTFDVYGDRIVAVCEHLRNHLIEELGIDGKRIEIIPNAIDFSKFAPRSLETPLPDGPRTITIIGRTTGEKGNKLCRLFERVFPGLLETFPKLDIRQVGGSPEKFSAEFRPLWEAFEKKFADRITFPGHQSDLTEELRGASLVIGGGRVALEAAHVGVPVFPFGESCRHSRLTPENLAAAIKTNFGDILPRREMPQVDYDAFQKDLTEFLKSPTPSDQRLSALVAERYGVADVARRLEELYRRMILRKKHARQVPVLMFHKIPSAPPLSRHKTWVTAERFEKHLAYLRRNGFQSFTMRDMKEFLTGARPLSSFPARPILLTFDDGYLDNYRQAAPIMQRYGFSGLIFCMGNPALRDSVWDRSPSEETAPLMSFTQIRELSDAGYEIGAHTLSHPHLPALSDEQARREILDSKNSLEDAIGQEVISFAYPYGEYDDRIVDIVREAGFSFAFATSTGAPNFFDDPFRIFRTHIFPKDRLLQICKKTSSWYRRYFLFKHGQ